MSADAEGEEGGEISDTERGLEGGGDSSFSLEVPLTAWGANDFDRGAILDRLRERQPHASSHSAASISKSLRTGNPMLRMVKMFSPSRRVPQDTRPAETETQVPCAHQDSDSQAPRSRVRASWDNDGEALSSSVSRTQMRHAEDDVRLDNQMRHSEDDVRLDKDEARRDKELEARILSRLENRRERGVAGHARGGSVPQSSHAEGGDGSAGEYGEHVQGSASPLEAWARVTAGAEVREMRGEEFLAGERGDAPIVNPPSAVGAARGASAGAVDAEGGRAAGTGAGGCEEGFSAQLAAIVAGLHDVVTSVQSSHVAAELRSLSDDQLMAAAATHSDPLAPSPWEVPGKEGASGSRMSEASLRRRAARPFRQVNEENVSPAPSPNRVLTSGSPTKRASQKRPASAGREAADHFNTSRSPFACISPHKQRCAADDAANNSPHASRRAARAASVSPHRQPKARGGSRGRNSREASASPRREPDTSNGAQGAAHAVAEAVSSISQWRPRWPISSAANSHLAPGQGASQGGAASAVSLPLPLRTTVSGDSGTAATSVHSALQQQHAGVCASVSALPESARPLRRAAREPHTLSDGGSVEGDNASADGGDGTPAVVGEVCARPVALSGNAGAAMVQAPPQLPSLTPTWAPSSPAKAAAPSALSPVGEWESKYQGGAPFGGTESDVGRAATAGEWESPREAPPVPTRYSPRTSSHPSAAAAPGPATRGGSVEAGGHGFGSAVPSPVVRAKDSLRHFFLTGTPQRAGTSADAGGRPEAGGDKMMEASPQPRLMPPAPLFAVGRTGDCDANEGPRADAPLPCPQEPESASCGRVHRDACDAKVGGRMFGGGVRQVNLPGSAKGVVVRLPLGEMMVISEETFDFAKPHRCRVMEEEWKEGSDVSEGEDSLEEGGSDGDSAPFANDSGNQGGAEDEAAIETGRSPARAAVLPKREARGARRAEARARQAAWMILEATPADVLRQEWPRHSPPFWMAIALEKADAPLLLRQRMAVGKVLAMERARLGKEVRAVWDKLRATLLELEQEALLQDLAQERLETREERRARAQNRVRGGGASASRSRSREASTDKESKPRSGPPLGVPSAAMYKRGRGDGPSMRGSLREQARSASRGSQDREGPRSSRDLGAGAQRQSSEARGQDKDEGHGMMSWVVDAVDPTQFRSLLLQNLVRKLRLRHGLVALCAYAQVSAVAVAATAGLALRLPVACRLWGWSALRHVHVEARQQRELADLHLASLAAKRHHRALVRWRQTAVFKNRLFLLAASARLAHAQLLKSRALAIWQGCTADMLLSRCQQALASSLLVMVVRGKVLVAWRRYARAHVQKRAAVLRFAEGVGRAELRLLEQQQQQQQQQQYSDADTATLLSRAGSPHSTSAASSAAMGSVSSAEASQARARRQMFLQAASAHARALASRRDGAVRRLGANCASSCAAPDEDAVAPVAMAVRARDSWSDKRVSDSDSDRVHGARGDKDGSSVLALGERYHGQGALAAARALFLHGSAKTTQEVAPSAVRAAEDARDGGGWVRSWRGVQRVQGDSSDNEEEVAHPDATNWDECEWSADDASASGMTASVGSGGVAEDDGRRRAKGGARHRPHARKAWKDSVRAIHRGRLLKTCVHEWREALLVAMTERVFSARRLRHLASVWVAAASAEAKSVAALRRRVAARQRSAAKLSALLSWALCCAAIGLGRRALQREGFSLLCSALLNLSQDREAFAQAARRTMLRSKALRRWLSFMRGQAAVLALLLQGQELYRRHLLWGNWSRWWVFARESARFRRGLEAVASRCRRSCGRRFLRRWAQRSRERALQVGLSSKVSMAAADSRTLIERETHRERERSTGN